MYLRLVHLNHIIHTQQCIMVVDRSAYDKMLDEFHSICLIEFELNRLIQKVEDKVSKKSDIIKCLNESQIILFNQKEIMLNKCISMEQFYNKKINKK